MLLPSEGTSRLQAEKDSSPGALAKADPGMEASQWEKKAAPAQLQSQVSHHVFVLKVSWTQIVASI